MGRKRKYNTPEEKAEAHRLASKKHYERFRNSINQNRRDEYHSNSSKRESPSKSSSGTDKTAKPKNKVEFWLDRARKLPNKLEEILGAPPKVALEELCRDFRSGTPEVAAETQAVLVSLLEKLQSLRKVVKCYTDHVLTLAGDNEDYRQVTKLCEIVESIQIGVDDLYLFTRDPEGQTAVADAYKERFFIFQTSCWP
ncbi:hypothetical protein FA15DRAFT_710305 [Coprinopsis marcescibilis]|uniref:Uncharacterized protein n=1 Tax=Coprinopsis marcescibilis TaxID=230819 RepID=A0A5C3KD23_COPMA|nr:hypothetical protein FA15DRAFT_710305 [Coprinopsis marcescibilis]